MDESKMEEALCAAKDGSDLNAFRHLCDRLASGRANMRYAYN